MKKYRQTSQPHYHHGPSLDLYFSYSLAGSTVQLSMCENVQEVCLLSNTMIFSVSSSTNKVFGPDKDNQKDSREAV